MLQEASGTQALLLDLVQAAMRSMAVAPAQQDSLLQRPQPAIPSLKVGGLAADLDAWVLMCVAGSLACEAMGPDLMHPGWVQHVEFQLSSPVCHLVVCLLIKGSAAQRGLVDPRQVCIS